MAYVANQSSLIYKNVSWQQGLCLGAVVLTGAESVYFEEVTVVFLSDIKDLMWLKM